MGINETVIIITAIICMTLISILSIDGNGDGNNDKPNSKA